MNHGYGATCADGKTHFRVRAPLAAAITLCLFDGDAETRVPMARDGDDWTVSVDGALTGRTYGYRAAGVWEPDRGLWFDPAKLLVDPYAVELDRRFAQHPDLAALGADTAALMPRARIVAPMPPVEPQPPVAVRGGLIYELNVRGFTIRHPDVPEAQRGTVAALAHPSIVAHLKKIGVDAIELMPITAWIDEAHLPPLGLRNAWGYNPVVPMALDPGLCPGGVKELRDTVAALHDAGIGVLLDLVFNHSGESGAGGPILSHRGLDNSCYAHGDDGNLINDSGCGNTYDFAQPHVRAMCVAALGHFAAQCGIDGFRFDLAPIMARGPGFDPNAPIFEEIRANPALADRIMIAEPWDIGPGGYQVGQFPGDWLEWNDQYRDDVRRFWRGDGTIGALVNRVTGSAELFGLESRSVNFLAAHDGFTLADTAAYVDKHNEANGEENRDGHGENFSWNCGVEGPTDDPDVRAARAASIRAMLGTLFASTGTIMLTAGDEFGRTQHGNNNAYAQDNEIGWVDWDARDRDLEDYVAQLSAARAARGFAHDVFPQDGVWKRLDEADMAAEDWETPDTDGVVYWPGASAPGWSLRLARWDRVAEWCAPG